MITKREDKCIISIIGPKKEQIVPIYIGELTMEITQYLVNMHARKRTIMGAFTNILHKILHSLHLYQI